MKRTGFKKKTYEEAKEIWANQKPRTPLRAESPLKSRSTLKSTKRINTKAYRADKLKSDNRWLTGIPLGSHGSNTYQKRLWKVVSDFVRIQDFYEYGVCISCPFRFSSWKDMQAGHFRAYSICRGYSKWDRINIFGQCPTCNTAYDGNIVGKRFAEGIKTRYGQDRLSLLDAFTNRPLEKLEDFEIVNLIRITIEKMEYLPEKPDYYEGVLKKFSPTHDEKVLQ